MASNQAVKVDVVDNKKNKGKKLADKSIRAFVDVDEVKDLIGGGGENRKFALGKLSITSGGDTYEYDGSQDVDIDISGGSGGGTYVYPLCFTKGDDDKSSGGGAYWGDLLNVITNDVPIAVEYYLSSDTSSLPAKCVAYVNSVRDTGDYTQGSGRVRKLYLSVRCAGTSKTDPCVDQLITVAKYYDQGNTVETTVDVIS